MVFRSYFINLLVVVRDSGSKVHSSNDNAFSDFGRWEVMAITKFTVDELTVQRCCLCAHVSGCGSQDLPEKHSVYGKVIGATWKCHRNKLPNNCDLWEEEE